MTADGNSTVAITGGGFEPRVGAVANVFLLRILVEVFTLGLSVAILGFTPLLAAAVVLTVLMLVFPRAPAAWALILLLAIVVVGPGHQVPGWQFYVALAGLHALHSIGRTLLWLPPRGTVQRSVLLRMARRYLIIQIPAQLVAFAILGFIYGDPAQVTAVTSPYFGIVAAVALVLLSVLVIAPIVRDRSRN